MASPKPKHICSLEKGIHRYHGRTGSQTPWKNGIGFHNSIDPDSTSQILNENQIFELLNEDIENIDVQFEQSERIINYVELQEIGDTSIFTNIRCVAHTLQLAVLDSLKDNTIQKLLNKVRALVRKLRNQNYVYLIKKEKLKTPILDCLTRWSSTYDMLERLQYLKDFIQNMSVNDKTLKKKSP
ncbi:uncharacterized protein LOC126549442 [Aphis gossypii]|uniref:uncharacterized protein LOC126549442 n=1 Tax=Aphis gossypii TaxID=80765 RepID=UPI002158E6BB|nr:uncharacterized protein LOC126549442 [Aphis gossypii]